LTRRDRQVAHHVQRVPATGSPAGHHGDDNLGHGADEALHLEDVEPADGGGAVLVLVTVATTDALVAARTERPTAILRAGSIAGEKHNADARVLARVVERTVELIYGVRTEGIPHLGPVERNTRHTTGHILVVGQVG